LQRDNLDSANRGTGPQLERMNGNNPRNRDKTPGVETRTCVSAGCNATETRTIPATGGGWTGGGTTTGGNDRDSDRNGGGGIRNAITSLFTPRVSQEMWKTAQIAATLMLTAVANNQNNTHSRHGGRYGVRAAAWDNLDGMRSTMTPQTHRACRCE